jgi:signal transduction histidine kinase
VRRRFILAIALVAAGSVGLFGLPLAVLVHRVYRDEALLRLQRDTVAAARQIDLGTPGSDPVELPPGSSGLSAYDRTGRRVAGSGPATADAAVLRTLRSGRPSDATPDGRLVAAVPLVVSERIAGAVRASRSQAAVNRGTRRAWLALAGLAAAVVGLAALAAALIGRRLAAPLERLAIAARRLGDGDSTARAPRAGVEELDAVARGLDTSAERLDQLLARERAFSADASHQLRTPLAALRIELEGLALRGQRTPELTAALGQVDRLEQTVSTLLAVARDGPQAREPVAFEEVLRHLEGTWRGRLAESGRPLRVLVEPKRPMVRASGAVVQEILNVLVDNATRHGAGEVGVTARDAKGWLAIDVTDEGPGLRGDPEDAFARRSGSTDGHGIGLALARSLADAEGGRLELGRAAPNPVFTLLLPSEGLPSPEEGGRERG